MNAQPFREGAFWKWDPEDDAGDVVLEPGHHALLRAGFAHEEVEFVQLFAGRDLVGDEVSQRIQQ